MTYLEQLRARPPKYIQECGLGKIIKDGDEKKYEDIVQTIFATIVITLDNGDTVDTGELYPVTRLVELFEEEYGWSDFFFRRHRLGKCGACQNR